MVPTRRRRNHVVYGGRQIVPALRAFRMCARYFVKVGKHGCAADSVQIACSVLENLAGNSVQRGNYRGCLNKMQYVPRERGQFYKNGLISDWVEASERFANEFICTKIQFVPGSNFFFPTPIYIVPSILLNPDSCMPGRWHIIAVQILRQWEVQLVAGARQSISGETFKSFSIFM